MVRYIGEARPIMRKGGGKSKGSSFERFLCKELSLWLSNGKHQDLLWRSAMSGGRSTVAMKKGVKMSAQVGDISSIHKLGHSFINRFMIEAKFYKSLNYDSLIKGNGNLITFWQRACEDAKTHGKLPMLIAKQNHFPVVVCLDDAGVRAFRLNKVKARFDDFALNLILWDDFLKIDPKVLKRKRTRI